AECRKHLLTILVSRPDLTGAIVRVDDMVPVGVVEHHLAPALRVAGTRVRCGRELHGAGLCAGTEGDGVAAGAVEDGLQRLRRLVRPYPQFNGEGVRK